ncbi:hypothetical protein B0H66DRAFT_593097 [Apodospora peruviana]|uniref:Uncharacterized protein n=1 Tax=Apodospora peruviana TaxID=516989 RepID=A0AAE0M2S0_9PEZI|nr:hypothetical protein B0H66DRAFT_593097 [Apodospora peruviana]
MPADHITMAKYTGLQDPNFHRVMERLRVLTRYVEHRVRKNWGIWQKHRDMDIHHQLDDWGAEAHHATDRAEGQPPLPHSLGPAELHVGLVIKQVRNRLFVGRKSVLSYLDRVLGFDPLENDLIALQYAHQSKVKSSIVALFRILSTTQELPFEPNFDTYFDFYVQQCQIFQAHRGSFVTIRTYQEIVDLFLDFHRGLDRQAVKASLQKRLQYGTNLTPSISETVLNSTIDLAVRLFLMMRVGDVPHSIASSKSLQWTQGTITHCNGVKLPRLFNARNLQRIGGLKLAWATNLEDHLRVVDDDGKVKIFCHPSYLMLHRHSRIFPDDFVEETLRTLKLLFPANDKSLKAWIISLGPEVDRSLATCGTLRAELRHIERFRYWLDRLVILKEVFDEAEPSSLSQWWSCRAQSPVYGSLVRVSLILAFTSLWIDVNMTGAGVMFSKAHDIISRSARVRYEKGIITSNVISSFSTPSFALHWVLMTIVIHVGVDGDEAVGIVKSIIDPLSDTASTLYEIEDVDTGDMKTIYETRILGSMDFDT